MSLQTILAAAAARLEAEMQLEALEKASEIAEQEEANRKYQGKALNTAIRALPEELSSYIAVTSNIDNGDWAYTYRLNIPECLAIDFSLYASGEHYQKPHTELPPELIKSEDGDLYVRTYENTGRFNYYDDLVIAIAHANANWKLLQAYKAKAEEVNALRVKEAQEAKVAPVAAPKPEPKLALPTAADVLRAINGGEFQEAIAKTLYKMAFDSGF